MRMKIERICIWLFFGAWLLCASALGVKAYIQEEYAQVGMAVFIIIGCLVGFYTDYMDLIIVNLIWINAHITPHQRMSQEAQ